MTTTGSTKAAAVVHVDLDGAPNIYSHHGWPYDAEGDPIFESGMDHLLQLLDRNELRATLFCIASDVADENKLRWLRKAVDAGHEIASHSLTHPELDQLDRSSKKREVEESKQRLEQSLGVEVRGFRAPSFQIDRETLELLSEAGYAYDSSVFPRDEFARRLSVPSILPVPHRPLFDSPLMELPLPSYSPSPVPFHPSYSLVIGNQFFDWNVDRLSRTDTPLVLLFHLIDLADSLPKQLLNGFKSRVYAGSYIASEAKRARCQRFLERVGEKFDLTSTSELLQRYPEPRKLVLGISTTHETGATLFRGTECLAAISEERMDRVKFSTKYPPTKAIDACIETAGVDPAEITDVVIGGLPAAKLARRVAKGQLEDTLDFHALSDYVPHFNRALYRAFALSRSFGYRDVLAYLKERYGVEPRLHFVSHHLCHAASAYRTAPFDDALIVTADGVGDDISVTVSKGQNGQIELLRMIPYPHSFGQFYTAATQLLGFRANRHEGKITGLSGFGDPPEELYEKVRSTLKGHGFDFKLDKKYYAEGIVRGFNLSKIKRGEDLFDALQYRNYKAPLKKLLEGYKREDVAAAFQRIVEEELVELVRPYKEKTGMPNLCLAGGVFANVKVNHHLFRSLGFENVYIYPHMGDGGLGPGAVLEFLQSRPKPFDTVYFGPDFSEESMEVALKEAAPEGLRYKREENLERAVAERLTKMKVIARFNGRMEFGPRALGNRTILYSTRDPEANDWLNKRLHRTEFMPFAPIVMEEHAEKLFNDIPGTAHACKFMTIILDCTEWTKENCPAIVHVDGTARPQFCSEKTNASMYRILSYFNEMTGEPILVNTSFNMHEEPIVCTPADAVRAYMDSRLDYLAIGPFLAWIEGEGSYEPREDEPPMDGDN